MSIPQLQIETTPAKLAYQTIPAVQEIEQPKAEMTIHQRPADLSIRQIPSTIRIDSTQAREEINMLSVFRSIDKFAQEGYQAWLESLAATAEEGAQLMKIEYGGGAIPRIAEQKTGPTLYDSRLIFVPSYGSVKIHFEPGRAEIDARANPAQIDVQTRKPDIYYRPGKVNFYMERYHSLKMYLADRQSIDLEL